MKKTVTAFLLIWIFIFNIIYIPGVASVQETCLLKQCSFEEKYETFIYQNGGSVSFDNIDGNGVLHFEVPDGTVSLSYTDVSCPLAAYENEYIIDVRVLPVAVEASSFIKLFDAKTSGNKWRYGVSINSDGTINMSGTRLGTWSVGEWVRLSMAYNLSAGTCDLYINGIFITQKTCTSLAPTIFRIDANSKYGSGNMNFYIDDIAIYTGSELLDSFDGINALDSVMNLEYSAKKYLGDAVAFSVGGSGYYCNGSKNTYNSQTLSPILSEGRVLLPEPLVKETLTQYPNVNSVSVNGTAYYNAESIALGIGKSYLYDARGMCILSDGEFPYRDSPNFISMFDEADYIYRYLFFDNPEGDTMLSDYKNGDFCGVHPRILYNNEDIQYIKSAALSDSGMQTAVTKVIKSADLLVSSDNPFSADCPDASKQNQATSFQSNIQILAEAYLLSDNTAYADKAAEYMNTLCQWENLAYGVSNLTTGHWAMGMAVGYDTFYNYLSHSSYGAKTLQAVKEASVSMAFADTMRAYKGGGGAHWITIRDNFSGVIGGGMLALCLALADEQDLSQDISYLLENIIKTNELAVSLYYPNGGYFEGLGYSQYMLTNLATAFEALYNCMGSDYGLFEAPGFCDAGDFFVYLQSKSNVLNFHDSSASAINTWLPSWFAWRFGKLDTSEMNLRQIAARKASADIRALLYHRKAVDALGDADLSSYNTDRYFYVTESGSFRNSFNTSAPVFVGFHGGRTGLSHDMLDLGQFVFESDGVSWAIDLGSDSYSLKGYFSEEGYNIYRKRPEGENCLVINPASNSDSYYGQALGASAELVDFETSPQGAKAAYNLTEAYARDVDSYIRGYYFGDKRNTLVVQDEINLKSQSELYWFMHTRAEIEIINKNEALLTYNGKQLRAEVYCNSPDYELMSMSAEPLDSSPTVEGQTVNTGVSKLTVHTDSAVDETVIAVKLIPINEYYTPSVLEVMPISSWSLPQGDLVHDTVITDASCDKNGNFKCTVQIPSQYTRALILIDGREVYEITDQIPLRSALSFSLQGLCAGSHEALLRVESNGTTSYCADRFECESIYTCVCIDNNLLSYKGESISGADDGWSLSSYGTASNDGSGFSLQMGSRSYVALSYRASKADYAFAEGSFAAECYIMLSAPGQFVFECQNQNGNWYLYEKSIFKKDGTLADGTQYDTNHWYKVTLTADFDSKTCTVYVDDKAVIKGYSPSSADSIYVCKLQYVSSSSSDCISYKNLSIKRLVTTKPKLAVQYTDTDAGTNAKLTLLQIPNDSPNVINAVYSSDGKKMLYAEIKKSAFSNGISVQNIPYAARGAYIKQIILSNETLKPYCPAIYKTIIK